MFEISDQTSRMAEKQLTEYSNISIIAYNGKLRFCNSASHQHMFVSLYDTHYNDDVIC